MANDNFVKHTSGQVVRSKERQLFWMGLFKK